MQEEQQLEDKAIDLLKFNYENLHEAVWNNHKASWVVTSIFIPILSTMLGYQVYYVFSKFQVLIGFFILESLLIIWFSTMRVFKHYNAIRFERLKEIEDIFNKEIKNIGFSQYKLHYREKRKEFTLSPMTVYWFVFCAYTAINVTLLIAKLLD